MDAAQFITDLAQTYWGSIGATGSEEMTANSDPLNEAVAATDGSDSFVWRSGVVEEATLTNLSIGDINASVLPQPVHSLLFHDLPQIGWPSDETVDELLGKLAQWYLDQMNAIGAVVQRVDQEISAWVDETSYVTLIAISVFIALFVYNIFYYFTRASGKARIYSQHIPGTATQLPPAGVQIDVTSAGPIRAVYQTVANVDSSFRLFVDQPYKPTPWLSWPSMTGHLQTLFTARASPAWLGTPHVTYTRELLNVDALAPQLLPGVVALDWGVLGLTRGGSTEVQEWHSSFTTTTPTVLICHGLAGGGSEHYVKNVIYHLSSTYGYRCVVFNARGCGGSKIINNQLYCGAYTEDLRQVVNSLKSRLPNAPLLAVGFSLGANILTKFVGEEGLSGRSQPFYAMASVANPFDFLLGSKNLEKNWIQRNMYSANLAKNLIRLFKRHLDVLEQESKKDVDSSIPLPVAYDLASVFESPSLREFDKRLTRVIFGYSTVDDYYRDASSARFVKFIKTPALFLNAIDDPISTHEAIPYDEGGINPYVIILTTKTGGHSMDWYTGAWKVESWSKHCIGTFFGSIMENLSAVKSGEKISTPPPFVMASDPFLSSISPESLSWSTAGRSTSPLGPLVSEAATMEECVQAAMELQARLDNALQKAAAEA